MAEETTIEFLNRSRVRIEEFVNVEDKTGSLDKLKKTSSDITNGINEIITFLKHTLTDKGGKYLKLYEDCVYKNRDVAIENEMANLLLGMQHEANGLMFLSNVDLTLNCTKAMIEAQRQEKDELIEKYNKLEKHSRALDTRLVKIDEEITKCKKELNSIQTKPHDIIGPYSMLSIDTIEKRLIKYRVLLESISYLPFKLLPDNEGHVYRYNIGSGTLTFSTKLSSRRWIVTVEPYVASIQKYLDSHITSRTNTSEIASIIQESLFA